MPFATAGPAMADFGRALALAFTTRTIRRLAAQHHPLPSDRLAPVVELAGPDDTLGDAFDLAYAELASQYRCEYVFANSLIDRLSAVPPDARHALAPRSTSNTISGLRVSMSIADLIVADKSAAAYEIKTGLDSFTRLDMQMLCYRRCFEYVNVVTTRQKARRAAAQTAAHVGVVTLTDDGALDVVRAAAGGLSRIDMSALFRVLRRGELLTILGRRVGYSIDVPSAQIYRRLNALFMQLPLDTAYDEFVAALRERDLRSRQAARDAQLPASLSAAASGLSLTPPGWRRLAAQLGCPAHEFRTRGTQGNGHGSIRNFNGVSIR